jgi:putative ABC transport system substrate-binding protein
VIARRRFLALLGAAISVVARNAHGQARGLSRVGFLNSASPTTYSFNADAFREGLQEAGFSEGRNVTIEYRWANGDYASLPQLAKELVRANVNVIAATGDIASARAAQEATSTIPIVFTVGSDPVQFGLVSSLSRPSGNATGITLFSSTLSAKRLELLREVIPGATTVALFMNPTNPNIDADVRVAREAAHSLGRTAVVVQAGTPDEFAGAFDVARSQGAGAVLIASDPMFLAQRSRLTALAAEKRMPVMYWAREFAESGGLITYGTGITWMYRQAGIYCGKILKGARPPDLPILQPSKFEMYINLKAAKALGLAIPQATLLRADEVIQ